MNGIKVDENLLRKALDLFGRTEESFQQDVQAVKTWLKTQKHLPEIMAETHIRNFLLINKCKIEKTKEKIDMYYTIRSLIPDVFNKSNPSLPHLKEYASVTYLCMHPVLVHGLYRVGFMKVKKPNILRPLDNITHLFDFLEILLKEDCIIDYIIFIDVEGATFQDILTFTPSVIQKIYIIFKNVYSLRVKQMHIINSIPIVSQILMTVKTIIKNKIFERIHMHQNAEILKTIFTQDELPKDYGGNGPSLQEMTDFVQNKFEEYKDRFDELDKLRVNEELRPAPLKNDEILGYYGNFKKLNVD